MKAFALLLIIAMAITSAAAFAGVTKVPSHIDKNGKYVHGHVKPTQSLSDTDPRYWVRFEEQKAERSEEVKKTPPFDQVYVPPTEGKLQFYDAPQMENYTNDPFDTN